MRYVFLFSTSSLLTLAYMLPYLSKFHCHFEAVNKDLNAVL